MNPLPFEVGYVSTMSDDEMLNIAIELERQDFWRREEQIQQAVDSFIDGPWRNTASGLSTGPTYAAGPFTTVAGPEGLMVNMKVVTLRVPQGVDERTARLLAEMQYREQIDPCFDPTDGD